MRRSSSRNGSSARLASCRSPAAAARLPSPPPPPQRRRSSLAMSLPSLENLLSQAPPADLTTAAAAGAPNGAPNAAPVMNASHFRTQLQARRSSLAAVAAASERMPIWPPLVPNAASSTSATTAANRSTIPFTFRSTRRASTMESTPVPTSSSRLSSSFFANMTSPLVTATTPSAPQAGDSLPTRRTSPRLREVAAATAAASASTATAGQKRSAATSSSATSSPSPPNKRTRKAPPMSTPRRTSSRNAAAAAAKLQRQLPTEPTEACCICLSIPNAHDVATINGCAHCFCYGCIRTWSETENSCPLCKTRFTSIIHAGVPDSDDANAVANGDRASMASVQTVPTRNQRSEAGIALDGLLSSLAAGLPIMRGPNGTLVATAGPFGPGGAGVAAAALGSQGFLGRFLANTLPGVLDGTAAAAAAGGGGAATFGVSPLASYAAAAAAGGGPPAELVNLGGLQLGGYSGDLSQAFGPVHDSMFQPSLLNVIMRSSTSTVTTTTTTSLGVLPTSTTLHLHHHHPAAAAAASAAAEATASLAAAGYPFMQAPPPPAAAAASAASVAGGRGGRTFSTAIEVDSDEDMPALEAAAAAHHF